MLLYLSIKDYYFIAQLRKIEQQNKYRFTSICHLISSCTGAGQETHFAFYELDFTDCENKLADLCLKWPRHTSGWVQRISGSRDMSHVLVTKLYVLTCDLSSVHRYNDDSLQHRVDTFMWLKEIGSKTGEKPSLRQLTLTN